MHGFYETQRLETKSRGNYRAASPRQVRASQSDQAPAERSLSSPPSGRPGRMGHRTESPRIGGRGSIPDPGAADLEPFSQDAARRFTEVSSTLRFVALALIRFYQAFLSPVWPSSCRFHPSCSAYAYEAVEKWGVCQGSWMALRRILRCRPWGGQGYDPVPEI
jgi:putative membrane protein insertion efficiency factor